MKRRPLTLAVLFFSALSLSSARADILEIKNKGFVNGTIVAETADTMKLRDTDGNLMTIPKSDVTYVQREDIEPVKGAPAPEPKMPEKKKEATEKPKDSGLGGYFQNIKDARDEQNQKIDFETQMLKNNHEMEEHQRAILNQLHPGTFPDSPADTSSFDNGTWKDTRDPATPRKRGNFSKLL